MGPVLSLLLAMKFGAMKDKKREEELVSLREKVELLEKVTNERETELPKKVMATILPVAKAVQKLNQQVGL